VPVVLCSAAFGWNVYFQRQLFFELPDLELFQIIYTDYPFVEAVEVSKYLRDNSPPAATVAVLGSEPEIYFDSRRHSATGYIYTYALVEPQPNAAKMQREMINEIEAAKPEFLVWIGFGNSWLLRANSDLTIFKWFNRYSAENYVETGLLNVAPDGKTSSLWGRDVASFHDKLGQYVTVFERRDLVAPPASSN